MNTLYTKSIVYGFALGTILFIIAPLGLGIGLIEILKPVLAPGALVTQVLLGSNGGVVSVVSGFVFNGAIFSLLFVAFYSFRKNNPDE